jgi:hypothetical protein
MVSRDNHSNRVHSIIYQANDATHTLHGLSLDCVQTHSFATFKKICDKAKMLVDGRGVLSETQKKPLSQDENAINI